MIVAPDGRRVSSDPDEQEVADAVFGVQRDLARGLFAGIPSRGAILDEHGKPMNRVAPTLGSAGGGLAAWIPAGRPAIAWGLFGEKP